MEEKLHEYQGWGGRYHEFRDNIKNKYSAWREANPESGVDLLKKKARDLTVPPNERTDIMGQGADYSHLYRKKTRSELIRISAAVMGIEFSYAAETAFVSPTLLKIGVEHQHMTLVWALSPLIGFFVTPILGSLSDRCRLPLGRRRPFIILLSIGVFLGLLLVPNGESLGYSMGDVNIYDQLPVGGNVTKFNPLLPHRATASDTEKNKTGPIQRPSHPWGVFFTILGTVMLDFDADACQSPARAYLLDVTLPEDHATGLSTFTIMAGLGGFMGYSMGGINWDNTWIGAALGGHVRAVFSIITVIFIVCVSYTITSFIEMPLSILECESYQPPDFDEEKIPMNERPGNAQQSETDGLQKTENSYGALDNNAQDPTNTTSFNPFTAQEQQQEQEAQRQPPPRPAAPRRPNMLVPEQMYATMDGDNVAETSFGNQQQQIPGQGALGGAGLSEAASLQHYLMSIVFMPHSMRMVCMTNLFCWMAHVCYSLYFTDFVGEAVFGGDPKAFEGTVKYELYESGIRFGCWGMAMYSLSCACYSLVIERLIQMFGAKRVYIGGLVFYSTGMTLMALTKSRAGVILFSWTAGVMYSTLFTMPYLLIAHYHSQGVFEVDAAGDAKTGGAMRGLGTDVAIVSSMVFLAQFILSLCMGTIVSVTGTTTAVVSVASFLAFCGALSATQIMYLDL